MGHLESKGLVIKRRPSINAVQQWTAGWNKKKESRIEIIIIKRGGKVERSRGRSLRQTPRVHDLTSRWEKKKENVF
jgi:hypothetical protein